MPLLSAFPGWFASAEAAAAEIADEEGIEGDSLLGVGNAIGDR